MWKVTIGGVDWTTSVDSQVSTPTIVRPLNDRSTFNFGLRTASLPTRFAEVIAYQKDGVTALFGGILLKRSVTGVVSGAVNQFVTVDCGDYFTYADWCYTSLAWTTSPTLKTVLTALVSSHLSVYGITLDAAQVTGPSLGAFAWTDKRVSDAIRELHDQTGYIARLTPGKVLSMVAPGASSGPYTLSDASPHCYSAEWADTDDPPANKVIVRAGPSGVQAITMVWTAAGVETAWQTEIPAALGQAPPGYVTVGGIFKTVGPGSSYTWDDTTSTLSLGTDTMPVFGTVISLVYVAAFPFSVTDATGGTPVIEYLVNAPEVTEYDKALEIAANALDGLTTVPREASLLTREEGWDPGETITSTLTRMVGSFLITNVTITLVDDLLWEQHISLTESTLYQGSYLDQWRAMVGGGSSGAVSLSGTTGGGTTTIVAGGSKSYFLGGSGIEATRSATPTWVPASGGKAIGQGAIHAFLDTTARGTVAALVVLRLRAATAGVSVQGRLYNVTDSVALSELSAVVTSTSWVSVAYWTTLTTGVKEYELQLLPGTANADVFGTGYVE